MSRGFGAIQRYIGGLIRNAERPMTFEEILRTAFPKGYEPGYQVRASVKRSFRRSLKKLIDGGGVMEIGEGGPGGPYRYFMDPMIFALGGSKEEFHAAIAILESVPGGKEAMNKAMSRMRRESQ
jgi:hypothetical protein